MNIREMIKLAKEAKVTESDIERIKARIKEINEKTSENERIVNSDEFLNRKYTV